MKRLFPAVVCGVICVACSQAPQKEVVKTTYFHAYGPEINESDWKAQGSSGEVVEVLKNGVEERKEFEGGVLHGTSSWTFPFSKVVERVEEYSKGTCVLSGRNYENGSPEFQEQWLPQERKVVHAWYEDGSPRSLEEYQASRLQQGQYFTAEGDVEGGVSLGTGTRFERTRAGLLTIREEVRSGDVVKRESFYANGQLREVALYQGGKRHGETRRYAENGQTCSIENWTFGMLDGVQTFFEGGQPVRSVPYLLGKKEGVEKHYRPGTNELVEEISWKNDLRHGVTRTFIANRSIEDWYWKGGKVSEELYRVRNEGALISSR